MRKTMKDLVSEAQRSEQYWKGRADANQTAKEELDKQQRTVMNGYAENNRRIETLAQNMLEIVRWHINPETAKYPFRIDKEQADPNNYQRNY